VTQVKFIIPEKQEYLEDKINEWLKNNSVFKIIDIKYTTVGDWKDGFIDSVMIIYSMPDKYCKDGLKEGGQEAAGSALMPAK